MLARKKNDLLTSVPISRVNSSQRLDLLASSSNPATPGERMLPSPLISYSTRQDSDQVPIMLLIGQLEVLLNELSKSVSTYQEDALRASVQKIIETNNLIRSRTREFANHQELDREINTLQEEGKDLDSRLKDSLRKLVNYRSELKQLPVTSDIYKLKNIPGLDVNDVLKYALKLAKFTKAPSSSSGVNQQVHPNNFVWPAEDALRRGMLAASSLQPDEIINQEIGSPQQNTQESQSNVTSPESKPKVDTASNGNAPTPSTASAPHPKAPRHVEPEQPLDLDLFDEDEFSD